MSEKVRSAIFKLDSNLNFQKMKRAIFIAALPLILISSFVINGQNRNLLPEPQQIIKGENKFLISGSKLLVSPDLLEREVTNINSFIDEVKLNTGISVPIIYSEKTAGKLIILESEKPGSTVPSVNETTGPESREAYKIKVTENRIRITAKSDAALFYSLQTLLQLIEKNGYDSFINEVEIEDYPAIPYRGVMMDFSHGGLLTEEEIKNQIDFLSRWKLNQYYFYNEVSIEMKGYPLINYNACYSQETVKRVVAYGREKHIDVIPFVNFYGHLHELIRLEKYSDMGIGRYGHDLDPRNPGVQVLLKDWISQYAEIFPSPFIHVGFDETWETERLTIEDSSINPRQLYLDQLNFVTKTLQDHDKTVMVWTDISRNYPDIIGEFPEGLIPVLWEYSEKPGSVDKWVKPVLKKNLSFFVQSAVDSWGNVYPASEYTMNNIDVCLKACRDHKAAGYITSVWTDAVQPLLRNTWLFMAYGSAGAWQKEPVDRDRFIDNYCKITYPGIEKEMAGAFKKMAEAESFLAACLGRHTLNRMWVDPFNSFYLENTNSRIKDFKSARLAAESALEFLVEARNYQTEDSEYIRTMLVNARMLHYTASRFIWAKTIVDRWNWIFSSHPEKNRDNYRFYDINYSTHGLTVDMMDYCTELKEEYRQAWLSENMKYRLGTILGRFDAEYLLWREIYNKIVDYRNQNNINETKQRFEEIFINTEN